MSNLTKYKAELQTLLKTGEELRDDLAANKNNAQKFYNGYQDWFTESQAVVKQVISDRLEEFVSIYQDKKRKKIDGSTYSISDWIQGIRSPEDHFTGKHYDDYGIAYMRFQNQVMILRSALKRFDSSLFDIKQIVQADLHDTELDAARHLNKSGFVRAAGAMAGVVIESHLHQVHYNHGIKVTKKNPGINDLAQSLKDAGVIDTPEWRKIQHLADLRNLCDHKKTHDPTNVQIEELIDGADKLIKTVF